MIKRIAEAFDSFNIWYNQDILKKLELYAALLERENKLYNLTRLIDDVVDKHFLDSAFLITKNLRGKLLDIGSGAGFPGLVLAIMNQNLEVHLVESSMKKSNFLEIVIENLNLKNVYVHHSRIEDFKIYNFHFATARAVSNLRTISEYSLPLLRIGGVLLAQKGPKYVEELKDLYPEELGCKVGNIDKYLIKGVELFVIEIIKTKNAAIRKITNIKIIKDFHKKYKKYR